MSERESLVIWWFAIFEICALPKSVYQPSQCTDELATVLQLFHSSIYVFLSASRYTRVGISRFDWNWHAKFAMRMAGPNWTHKKVHQYFERSFVLHDGNSQTAHEYSTSDHAAIRSLFFRRRTFLAGYCTSSNKSDGFACILYRILQSWLDNVLLDLWANCYVQASTWCHECLIVWVLWLY